ncbi:hypothetical protein SVIOM342S_03698 [Streptomyces violaceorubidus]
MNPSATFDWVSVEPPAVCEAPGSGFGEVWSGRGSLLTSGDFAGGAWLASPAAPVRSVVPVPLVSLFGMKNMAYATAPAIASSISSSRVRPRLRGERSVSGLPRLCRPWCAGSPARRLRTSSPRRRTIGSRPVSTGGAEMTCRPASGSGADRTRERSQPLSSSNSMRSVRVEHLGARRPPATGPDGQHFLTAVGVEGPGLGEFVLVGRRQGQAVAVGEHPSRVVVHVATPGSRRSIPFARRAVPAAYGPQPLTIRAGGNPQ